jgi:hypothetical protein
MKKLKLGQLAIIIFIIIGVILVASLFTRSSQPSTNSVLNYLNQNAIVTDSGAVVNKVEFLRQKHVDDQVQELNIDGATLFTWTEKAYEEYTYLATTSEGIQFLVFYRTNFRQFSTNFEDVYHTFKQMEENEQKIESGLSELVMSKEYQCWDRSFTSSSALQVAFQENLRIPDIDWNRLGGCELIVKLNADLATLRQDYREVIENILKNTLSVEFQTSDNQRILSIGGFAGEGFRVYAITGQSAFYDGEEDF